MACACSYDPRWDADYACVGGQEWTACGTPCIRTCHYKPDPANPPHNVSKKMNRFLASHQLIDRCPNYISNALTRTRTPLSSVALRGVSRAVRQCPKSKPVWDREYGCITQDLCDQYYGDADGRDARTDLQSCETGDAVSLHCMAGLVRDTVSACRPSTHRDVHGSSKNGSR